MQYPHKVARGGVCSLGEEINNAWTWKFFTLYGIVLKNVLGVGVSSHTFWVKFSLVLWGQGILYILFIWFKAFFLNMNHHTRDFENRARGLLASLWWYFSRPWNGHGLMVAVVNVMVMAVLVIIKMVMVVLVVIMMVIRWSWWTWQGILLTL